MTNPNAQESGRPVWLDDGPPRGQPLMADAECDVCVVGAGIAGLLIAERLVREGLKTILLDKGQPVTGETGHTTAHFASALDDRFYQLEKMHGAKGARLAADSHAAAIDYAEALVQRLGSDCQFRRLDGYLFVNEHHREDAERLLEQEREAATRAGLTCERAGSLPEPWPSQLGPALRFAGQAQLHPVRLLRSVVESLRQRGAGVHSSAKATEFHSGADARVVTEDGPVVRARHVVVATNTPVNDRVAMHTKQAGYQTYVVAFRVPRGSLPPVLLWDGLWEDDKSYRYIRLIEGEAEGGDDLLIVGGEDHKTGQGPDGDLPFRCIEEWVRLHLPMAGPVERRWSGEVMEPADGLGYIGPNPGGPANVHIFTGDSGSGMTHGCIAAMLIPDLILGRSNPWATLYDPARKIGLSSFGNFARENVNTLSKYADWLKRGDVADESVLGAGEGAIIRSGLRHVAVYKDPGGAVTRLSAVCPHLGCVVRFNSVEKTWDCPCHGSRFDATGRVLHGPAIADLTPERDGPGPEAETA